MEDNQASTQSKNQSDNQTYEMTQGTRAILKNKYFNETYYYYYENSDKIYVIEYKKEEQYLALIKIVKKRGTYLYNKKEQLDNLSLILYTFKYGNLTFLEKEKSVFTITVTNDNRKYTYIKNDSLNGFKTLFIIDEDKKNCWPDEWNLKINKNHQQYIQFMYYKSINNLIIPNCLAFDTQKKSEINVLLDNFIKYYIYFFSFKKQCDAYYDYIFESFSLVEFINEHNYFLDDDFTSFLFNANITIDTVSGISDLFMDKNDKYFENMPPNLYELKTDFTNVVERGKRIKIIENDKKEKKIIAVLDLDEELQLFYQ